MSIKEEHGQKACAYYLPKTASCAFYRTKEMWNNDLKNIHRN